MRAAFIAPIMGRNTPVVTAASPLYFFTASFHIRFGFSFLERGSRFSIYY